MPRMRIGDMLIRAKLIDEAQLNAALAHQRLLGGKIGDILVDQGVLDEGMLWLGLSKQLDLPLVSLPEMVITNDVFALVPADTCDKLEIFPVARDDRTLTVATSDPNNIGALDELAFRTGLKVKTVLAPHREIVWAIRFFYRADRVPCPPARQRPQPGAPASVSQAVQAPSTPQPVRQNQTPLAEIAMATLRPPNVPLFGLPPPVPTPPSARPSAEEQLRQANEMLRVLVELCINRGVFTREELWTRLTTKR